MANFMCIYATQKYVVFMLIRKSKFNKFFLLKLLIPTSFCKISFTYCHNSRNVKLRSLDGTVIISNSLESIREIINLKTSIISKGDDFKSATEIAFTIN